MTSTLLLLSLVACRNAGEPCTPAQTLCAQEDETLLTCDSNGRGWSATTCDPGLVCDVDACVPPSVLLITEQLPDGVVGEAYSASLQAASGAEPYTWTVASGSLPDGIELAADGTLSGIPSAQGSFTFTAAVYDDAGTSAEADLSITVTDMGVVITTTSLPSGEDGFPYSAQLSAMGGSEPYGWLISEGALPAGLSLFADGRIEGTVGEVGQFPITVRVSDDQDQPTTDTSDFTIDIGIAPLSIVGAQSYDLFLFTVVVLDVLLPFIPYSDSLEAQGGLKPYTWTEQDIPQNIEDGLDLVTVNANPTWGLPADLTVQPDGSISGFMLDTTDAPSIEIPFTGITLTGYFFAAQVEDSQSPGETEQGIFLIPTVPVGIP